MCAQWPVFWKTISCFPLFHILLVQLVVLERWDEFEYEYKTKFKILVQINGHLTTERRRITVIIG